MNLLAEIVMYHQRANGDIFIAHWVLWTYFIIIALYLGGLIVGWINK